MLRAPLCSMAMILGLAALAAADDAKVPDKPITAEERDHWAFRPPRRVRAAGRPRIAAGSGTRSTPSSWRGSNPTT